MNVYDRIEILEGQHVLRRKDLCDALNARLDSLMKVLEELKKEAERGSKSAYVDPTTTPRLEIEWLQISGYNVKDINDDVRVIEFLVRAIESEQDILVNLEDVRTY